jgi:hypothetical protein
VKAENTKNDKNLDILEIAVNDPPKARDLFITGSDIYLN